MDLYHLTTLWRKRFPQMSTFEVSHILKSLEEYGGFNEYIENNKTKERDLGSEYVTDTLGIELRVYIKKNILIEDIKEVIITAEKLGKYLGQNELRQQMDDANSLGNSSKKIQDIFINYCEKLGFESEKNGLFKYHNLRPDYYKKLNTGGILFEVERGKTLTNNMDLYDLWKCHICKEANHLFLFVPKNVSHKKNIYESTFRRFSSFFREEKNHINIDTVFLFGY